MSIVKKEYILYFLFFSFLSFSQEKKESIIIVFDVMKGDKKITENNLTTFILNENDSVKASSKHLLIFTSNNDTNNKNLIISKVESKLINGLHAIKKVELYLQKKALECEKKSKNKIHCQTIRNPAAYYYNNYFDTIFIYEKISEVKGLLHKVNWIWGIE